MGLQHIHCLQLCFPNNTFGRISVNMGLQHIHWRRKWKPTPVFLLATVHGVAESDMPERLTVTHTHTQHTSTTLVFSHLRCLGEFLSISQVLLPLFNGCAGLHRLEMLRSDPSHSSNQWNVGRVSKLGSTTQFLVV